MNYSKPIDSPSSPSMRDILSDSLDVPTYLREKELGVGNVEGVRMHPELNASSFLLVDRMMSRIKEINDSLEERGRELDGIATARKRLESEIECLTAEGAYLYKSADAFAAIADVDGWAKATKSDPQP